MRSRVSTVVSEDSKRDIKNVFRVFDPSNEGCISVQEVAIALKALDLSVSKEELHNIVAQTERTHGRNDIVKYIDFYNFALQKLSLRSPEEELHRAFALFDDRRAGVITFEDLQRKAHEVGEYLTDEEVQEMIEEADCDGDGDVTEEDFVRMLSKTERLLLKSSKG